jgi:hypothetical protein
VIRGLSDPSTVASEIRANCLSGNCTFPELFYTPSGQKITHASLAFSTQCINTTTLIKFGTELRPGTISPNMSLPNGLTVGPIQFGLPAVNVMSIGDLEFSKPLWTPEFAGAATNSFMNFSVLTYSRAGPQEAVIGASCIMNPCVQYYFGNVSNNIVLEEKVFNVTMERHTNFSVDRGFNAFKVSMPCKIGESLYTSENISLASGPSIKVPATSSILPGQLVPKACFYEFGGGYSTGIVGFYRDLLNGSCTTAVTGLKHNFDCGGAFWLEAFPAEMKATFESISQVAEVLAASLTNRVRNVGKGSGALSAEVAGRLTDSEYAASPAGRTEGQVNRTTICVIINWYWIAFPASLLFLSALAVLLAIVMDIGARGNGVPVWKSSLLPLLFHGLNQAPSNQYDGVTKTLELDEMTEKSKQMMVMLEHGGMYKTGFVQQ